ncbi:MAG: hypothetical protein LBU89_05670 [Fibromonadaceae bacterium]|jgi:hypothetical protein|nr:hypothetical protein [Fibromonadaceae bacterium]
MSINSVGNYKPPISAELMYQFYDNKAITPQIRSALQKKQEMADAEEGGSSSASKFGPATRVNITDQIVRMNMANSTTKTENESEKAKKPSRFDALEYVKNNVAEREAKAKEEKDAQLKEIADKIAAEEAAKKAEEEKAKEETEKEG